MANIVNVASENHAQQMKRIAEFMEADSITYKDLGNGKDYILIKGGKSLTLSVRGNKFDGGFLCVE